MKKLSLIVLFVFVAGLSGNFFAQDAKVAGKCMTCHKEKTPGIYKQWNSRDSQCGCLLGGQKRRSVGSTQQ
jgi:hypothetical protein